MASPIAFRPSAQCKNMAAARVSIRASQRAACVTVNAYAPPPVADTKVAYLKQYNKPLPAMYNTVVQELLVQQHFMRYNIKYQYDEIFALGIVSVMNQILDDIPEADRDGIFTAYITALDEDPAKYKADAEKLTELASACSSSDDLVANADGTEIQKLLAGVASRTASGDFFYTRFFAIGLFRLLELTEAKDPKALEGLVKGLGVKSENVNKDLLLYKSILSKMMNAKELMKEFLEREKRKQAEREAAKAAKAAGTEVASS